jgi:hypothetical protein
MKKNNNLNLEQIKKLTLNNITSNYSDIILGNDAFINVNIKLKFFIQEFFIMKGYNILLKSLNKHNNKYILKTVEEEWLDLTVTTSNPYNNDLFICLNELENVDIIKILKLMDTNKKLAISLLKNYYKLKL